MCRNRYNFFGRHIQEYILKNTNQLGRTVTIFYLWKKKFNIVRHLFI